MTENSLLMAPVSGVCVMGLRSHLSASDEVHMTATCRSNYFSACKSISHPCRQTNNVRSQDAYQ